MIKNIFQKIFKNKDSKELKKLKDSLSFKQSMELTDLPIVTFYQNGEKLNFILDTGATDCLIDERVLENKGLKYEDIDRETVTYGIDGIAKRTKRCKMNIEYNNNIFESEFLVKDLSAAFDILRKQDGVKVHGLIGSKFLNRYKYIIDFNELIAYNKQ